MAYPCGFSPRGFNLRGFSLYGISLYGFSLYGFSLYGFSLRDFSPRDFSPRGFFLFLCASWLFFIFMCLPSWFWPLRLTLRGFFPLLLFHISITMFIPRNCQVRIRSITLAGKKESDILNEVNKCKPAGLKGIVKLKDADYCCFHVDTHVNASVFCNTNNRPHLSLFGLQDVQVFTGQKKWQKHYLQPAAG
ncbi:hypothetical protein BJV82DRAFT_595351 [Fennellomyces sp. T-0311]|nr:hypothetical protein BJV82DRAFT_595351 [Fennellomyces sp. T-0311]